MATDIEFSVSPMTSAAKRLAMRGASARSEAQRGCTLVIVPTCNPRRRLRVALKGQGAETFCDCRFERRMRSDEEWSATSKGMALRNEDLDALIEALERARQAMRGTP
jgi:hypothetical protein